MKNILTIVISYFLSISLVNAQNAENYLFESICKELQKKNEMFLLKKQMPEAFLGVDPVSGAKTINYTTNIDDYVRRKFKKYSFLEQVEILETESMAIFPLEDTTYISDSNYIFTSSTHFLFRNHFFKITKKQDKKYKLKLLGIAFRDNDLIFSFAIKNTEHLMNYYFKCDSNMKFDKSKHLINHHSLE